MHILRFLPTNHWLSGLPARQLAPCCCRASRARLEVPDKVRNKAAGKAKKEKVAVGDPAAGRLPAKTSGNSKPSQAVKRGAVKKSPRLRPTGPPRRVSWGVVETRRFRASKPVANKPLPSSAAAKAALKPVRKQK
mmetsp:Transcript_28993/g.63839  ORF Transcript_28993/g.63839 Transcript_28993/m.63839 type:complete len:135 (+) Transcript_28993:272-676(+)